MKVKLLIFLCLTAVLGFAQSPTFVAQVSKNQVQVGEQFQLLLTMNGGNGGNLRLPDMKDFNILGGPMQSNSTTIVNGAVSQSSSLAYIISAKKEGKLTIGPAVVTSGNQKLETKPIVIDARGGGSSGQANSAQPPEQNQGATPIGNEDVFVRAFLSKTKCMKGEQLHLTYKMYLKHQLITFEPRELLNTVDGFWNQKEPPPANYKYSTETINGINYYVWDLYSTYLFPQTTGELTIEPIELAALVRRQVKRAPRNIFEQITGANGYEDAEVRLKSKALKVSVSDLPEQGKPADFNGTVGSFSYRAELNKQQVKANEAVNLKITLSGKGNIKLTEPPRLNLPESFEIYDPKISEKISTSGGVSGTKTFDYILIPRESGRFTLGNLSFSYFDPEKKQYVSLPSPGIELNVLPGDANSAAQVIVPKHQVDEKENDIRYIKTGDLGLTQGDSEFFSSPLHYILLGIPVLLFIGGIFAMQRQRRLNSDTIRTRQRRAARMAKKQLTLAEKHMKTGQKELFFDEVLAALNKYISHKLNIPVADLSRENIRHDLVARQIKAGTLAKLEDTLNTCEYAKYAPGAVTGDLKAVYNNTVELITEMEEELK